MKRLTVLFAVLAVVLGTSSAFKQGNSHRFFTQYYSYVGGPVTSPSSYTPIGAADPDCGESTVLCAIKVKQSSSSTLPDSLALRALYNASGSFANPGDYSNLGKVEKRPE